MRGHKCYGTPIDLNSTGPQFNRSSALVSCLMYEGEGLGRHHHEHLLKENDYENGHDYYEHLLEGNITLTVYKSSFM